MNGEMRYVDNGYLKGWYFETSEGELYGDGTFETASNTKDNFNFGDEFDFDNESDSY